MFNTIAGLLHNNFNGYPKKQFDMAWYKSIYPDHGWGGMQFALGGAVLGRSYVGTPPVLANGGPDDVGQGRLLPALSVDQYGGTLANWFGVSATDQLTVLPSLANFTTRNLGFMAG